MRTSCEPLIQLILGHHNCSV
ncbi:hypothetical protein Zm00014a_002424 [Zea mays]|uniref:Uncharacterized protein n=1 Tax=Zea mays TaxID=4577 RepID=A0A317YIV7_MAIZE|nr:hypothetical protein Zm00014a_002424 [Zea mays]